MIFFVLPIDTEKSFMFPLFLFIEIVCADIFDGVFICIRHTFSKILAMPYIVYIDKTETNNEKTNYQLISCVYAPAFVHSVSTFATCRSTHQNSCQIEKKINFNWNSIHVTIGRQSLQINWKWTKVKSSKIKVCVTEFNNWFTFYRSIVCSVLCNKRTVQPFTRI